MQHDTVVRAAAAHHQQLQAELNQRRAAKDAGRQATQAQQRAIAQAVTRTNLEINRAAEVEQFEKCIALTKRLHTLARGRGGTHPVEGRGGGGTTA